MKTYLNILRFLNLIWIPVKMSAKAFYHYCIFWLWDLYKTSFLALNGTYNKSKLRVAFIGSFYTLSIIGVSVYLSLLTGFIVIGMIGLVISCLPIIRSYGTLTSIIHGSVEADHNAHGSHVMKTALNYVIAVLVSIVVIEALARGIPVISTKNTPWSELIDYSCGWWIDRTKEDFKSVLLKLINTDSKSLLKMGKNGMQCVLTELKLKMLKL